MTTEIAAYHAACAEAVRPRLKAVHDALAAALPADATTCIAWGMPTFRLTKHVVHYAAFKHHIGIFPGPATVALLAPTLEAEGIGFSKGAIRLAHDRALPLELVQEVVRVRLEVLRATGR